MGLFLPLRRATLLIPSGPATDLARKHLFILLTDPCPESDGGDKCVLMVSLSSVRPPMPYDSTCILRAGDHPFVKNDSYVVYQRSRIEAANKLLDGVKQGVLIPQQTMDATVFARICKGLEESQLTPAKHLNFYRRATGPERP